ncbi:MAG: Na+/H+ antiporter NhaC family protein [Bacteroidaceae bacterium]|nr:Na+/H+ antiporter NhaC family protein [Bacteroidaceae bacterium]
MERKEELSGDSHLQDRSDAISEKQKVKALSPLILFLILYLATSIIAQDFYKVPIAVAFLVSAIYALLTIKGTMNERIKIFAQGAGSTTMVLMLAIFILAGAFAASAKTMGAVDATVNLALTHLPEQFILPGIFLASCFISLSIGTSCGTIAALTPLAVGIATQSGISVPLMVGLVVGGTYFGDNLSFISDTTIVATQTQGCSMKDKFHVNIRIVAPVAVLMLIIYYFLGKDTNTPAHIDTVNFWLVLPYLAVVMLAICGVNVLLVLTIGIILTGIIGIAIGAYDVFGWFSAMNEGMMGMAELIIMTILAGGMLEIIRHNGGIDLIIKAITRNIHGKRGGELSIAALTCLVNICTANNTVAIITTGPIAKDIARRFHIAPRRSASILDTASCFTQGLLPYGAQVLIAASLSSLNPIAILPYLFYPLLIGLALLLAILFRYPRKFAL